MNCCKVPAAIVAVAGVIVMEAKWAFTTVIVLESLKEPTVAVMVVVPAPTREAKPELSIVATVVDDEFQLTPVTRSAVEPSL